MKKILLFSLLSLAIIGGVQAQERRGGGMGRGGGMERGEGRPDREKVEALKIGFLTERLNLTPEEAKVFWPVYNKYQDELEQWRRNRRDNILNDTSTFSSMSDAEIEKMVDGELTFHQGELDILKKYHPQFKKILPIRKVALLYRSEEDFKRHLLDLIKERRRENRRNG